LNEAERLEFADGLYVRGMHDLAIREYESYLRDFPHSDKTDRVLFRLGECQRQRGDKSAAEKLFGRVFKDFPASPFRLKAGFRRADLFMEAGLKDAAIDLYKTVLNEKPPDDIASASLYFLGVAYAAREMPREAVETFQEVTRRFPTSPFNGFAQLKLGELYGLEARTGGADAEAKLKKAIEHYEAVAAKPDSPRVGAEALFQIAEIHFGRGAYEQSAAAYRRLLDQYPDDTRSSEAVLQAAWAAHHAGLYAEALGRAEAKLKSLDGAARSEWLYLKANCERQLMKFDEAIRTYTQLVDQFNDSFTRAARYEMALTYYRMGRYEDAMTEAGRITLTPEVKQDVYWLLAESCSALKRDDEAIQYYRLITRDFPDSARTRDALYRLAHHLQARGEFQEAARQFKSVAERFPESELAPQSLFASAYCLASGDAPAEAVRDWAALIRNYPQNTLVEESLYQKAMLEIRLRRDADAHASLQTLLAQFPAGRFLTDACFWQGMLMAEGGQTREAVEAFRRVLAAHPREDLARKTEFHLGVALQKLGQDDEAARLFQALLATPVKESFTPALLEWLADYAYAKADYPASASAAALILERADDPAWQQIGECLMGRARLAQGDRVGARTVFEQALARPASTPLAAVAALHAGDLAFEAGEPEIARQRFATAATLAKDEAQANVRARAYVGLAKTAKAASDDAAAARYYASVAILYEDTQLVPECLFEAMLAFARIADRDAAVKTADELLTRYPDSDWAARARKWKEENAKGPESSPAPAAPEGTDGHS